MILILGVWQYIVSIILSCSYTSQFLHYWWIFWHYCLYVSHASSMYVIHITAFLSDITCFISLLSTYFSFFRYCSYWREKHWKRSWLTYFTNAATTVSSSDRNNVSAIAFHSDIMPLLRTSPCNLHIWYYKIIHEVKFNANNNDNIHVNNNTIWGVIQKT